jgi:hypothetical protein
MQKIKLSKGLFALVSPEDYERVSKFNWTASNESRGGRKWYAIRFEMREGKRIKIRLHRFIMGLDKGDERVVDHLDGDGLDNRRCNLRVCTQRENMETAPGWRGSKVVCLFP